jgi:hypothetical protein
MYAPKQHREHWMLALASHLRAKDSGLSAEAAALGALLEFQNLEDAIVRAVRAEAVAGATDA